LIWLAFALIGSLAGFLAGYLGIGGGLVMVPALTFLFTRDPATAGHAVHMAVATSLATMLVTALSSIAAHQRRHAIDWRTVRNLAPGLVAGAIGGAWLADGLDTRQLAMVFGVFALIAGLQMIFFRARTQQHPLPGPAGSGLTGLLIGGISSMVGIGGGSMTAPWLMWHGVLAQRAVATAAACGYPIALAGTLSFLLLGPGGENSSVVGYVHLHALAGIVLFSILGAPLGAAAVHRTPAGTVRKVFGVLMLVVAARMLL